MTVGELIEALKEYDPDTKVTFSSEDYDFNVNEVFPYNGGVVLSA